MTIYAPSLTANIAGGAGLDVIDGSATLDEGWSPFCQARLTIHMPDPATFAALDPRNDARVQMLWRQSFVDSEPVATLTDSMQGWVSSMTAAFGGQPIASISADGGVALNAFGFRSSVWRRFDLAVRERTPNYKTKTVQLSLASDEALLQDFGLVDIASYVPGSTSVRQIVVATLSRIGATLAPGTADGVVDATASIWQPGTSGWGYVQPMVQKAGLRLWCDEKRIWHLDTDVVTVDGVVTLSGAQNVTDGSGTASRDDDWADAVVIKYSWTDPATNTQQVRYDTAQTSGYSKVLSIEYSTPYPGAGAAQRVLNRALSRGQALTLTAIADPEAEPGMAFTAALEAGDQAGTLSAVSWAYPDNTMQVKTRDVTDISAAAWAKLPAGDRWIDSPPGQTWANEVIS